VERTLPSPGKDLEVFLGIGILKQSIVKSESKIDAMSKGVSQLATITHQCLTSSEASLDIMTGILQSLKS
jgi:hypothetical protein